LVGVQLDHPGLVTCIQPWKSFQNWKIIYHFIDIQWYPFEHPARWASLTLALWYPIPALIDHPALKSKAVKFSLSLKVDLETGSLKPNFQTWTQAQD
jgi:hypothetical protein